MRRVIISLALMSVIGIVGCAKKGTSGIPEDTSVTDITPAPAPAYQPATPTHSTNSQPVVYDAMQGGSTGTATAMGGGSYTVKKGDTLYSIARSRYGDGKQWQRITAANPGLEPSKLRVGQTITVP